MEINFENVIEGSHVILRKIVVGDASTIFRWRTSSSGKFLKQPEGYNVEMQEKWINNRKNDEVNYIILDRSTRQKVGMVGIYNVNKEDRVAEVGRLLLDDYYLGKSNPYGLEALLLTYNFVFNYMHFRKISGIVVSKNNAMVKLQLFLGMKQEGYLKKHIWLSEDYEDVYVLSIFKDEFDLHYKKKIQFLLNSFQKAQEISK